MAVNDNTIEDSVSETAWNNASDGGDLTTTVDQSILGNLKSNAPANQITAEDMVSYVPDDLSPEQQQQLAQEQLNMRNASPGALPVEQYYPGIHDPIAKGNYSGSIIGSTTLFAPGGAYMPYGVVAAREKAIQDAASKRMQQVGDFSKEFQAPITKHSSVQRNLNDLYYGGLQQWVGNSKKKYGTNWQGNLKNDVGFQKWNRSMNTLKEQEDYMVDRLAGLQKEIDSGTFVATPELLKAKEEFLTGVNGLAQGPGNAKGYDLADSVLKFNTEYELNKVLNTAAKEIKYGVAEKFGIDKNDPNYDAIVSRKVKSVDDATLRDVAKKTKEQLYPNSSYITEDKIFQGLRNYFPGETEVQVQTAAKRDEGGIGEKIDETMISTEPSTENVDFQMSGGTTNQEQAVGYYGVTLKKPIKTVLSTGTRVQYPQASEGGMISQTATKGPQNAVIGTTKVYEVIDNPGKWDDGRIVTAQWKERNPNSKTRHEVMSSGYFIEKQPQMQEETQFDPTTNTMKKTGKQIPVTDGNGVAVVKEVQVPFYVPAKDIRNSIEKRDGKGNYVSGIPVDKLNQKAEELNKGNKPYEGKVDTETNKTVIVKPGQQPVNQPKKKGKLY